jgi:hypothetical protein
MSKASSITYGGSLMAIPHYRSFPAMVPFVSEDYDSNYHSKLLIIGEGFYFPKKSSIHSNARQWYATTESLLSQEEVKHINCQGLLRGQWDQPGHRMYRELNGCIAEFLNMPTAVRPIGHVAYTNAFMRPSTQRGGSFKNCCESFDVEVSINVLSQVIRVLAPGLVFITSKFAWERIGRDVEASARGIEFHFTAHPTAHFYWRRQSYEHGRNKFLSLLKKWVVVA